MKIEQRTKEEDKNKKTRDAAMEKTELNNSRRLVFKNMVSRFDEVTIYKFI